MKISTPTWRIIPGLELPSKCHNNPFIKISLIYCFSKHLIILLFNNHRNQPRAEMFCFLHFSSCKMWESPVKFLFPGEHHPKRLSDEPTPPSLHSLNGEKHKIPHVWFQPWQQKSKFGSNRAGGEDRREDFLFHPSLFLSFSPQRRKNFPTFSKRALGEVSQIASCHRDIDF